MDRLDAMRVILAVVDAGSLSAGSRKLNAPLPSVSRKVAELERHLGTTLIVRTSRNIQLTSAGRDYVEAARRIVADLDEAERRASGEYQTPRGELAITTSVEFGARIVQPIVLAFMEQYADVTVRFLAVDRMVHLIDEQVDIAIRLGPLADSALHAARAGNYRMLTCASPRYLDRRGTPQHPLELIDHDGILFGNPSKFWTYHVGGDELVAAPCTRLSVSTAAGNLMAALSGVGIARLFDYQLRDEFQSGALVPILTEYDGEARPVHIVYTRQGLLPLKVRAFIDFAAPRLRAACCGESAGPLEPYGSHESSEQL
ncbi:DNA-binding transcriptional LysR family regulator [Rhizobium pisi]|uniref:HTH-type transcriptional regulator TtuA n=1 Tax=Rhizobium pisi TaxID=574561 RepID=A0A3R9AWW7_9HYPH|nr:LysR family transcriptional regulator [Rhizobium pisi]MBB3138784.1 DNA-binding transcriptional LysR family regulator [Rhizobium pisi]RSB61486.1 LysR family transcriptional regulator [Rhizobium pisi]TCA43948.1 LysR family transcriptional regulator [Rhizobium pisi]